MARSCFSLRRDHLTPEVSSMGAVPMRQARTRDWPTPRRRHSTPEASAEGVMRVRQAVGDGRIRSCQSCRRRHQSPELPSAAACPCPTTIRRLSARVRSVAPIFFVTFYAFPILGTAPTTCPFRHRDLCIRLCSVKLGFLDRGHLGHLRDHRFAFGLRRVGSCHQITVSTSP